jgi:hypothetical protein
VVIAISHLETSWRWNIKICEDDMSPALTQPKKILCSQMKTFNPQNIFFFNRRHFTHGAKPIRLQARVRITFGFVPFTMDMPQKEARTPRQAMVLLIQYARSVKFGYSGVGRN